MYLPCAALLLTLQSYPVLKQHSPPEIHWFFGSSVAGLGDVDADGVPDFLIADPGEPGPGRVWAISGKTSRVLYACDGVDPGDFFGWGLRSVGDVDGDGVNDWIAGCDGPWKFDECRLSFASVHSGRDGGPLFLIRSNDLEEELGRCFAGAGDVDGDGKEDLVIGARRCASSAGVASIYSGSHGKRIRELGKELEPGTRAIDIAGLGDCDGDQVPDILISLQAPTEHTVIVHRVTLFSGANGDPLWHFETQGDQFIECIRPAGDVDGDGCPDALVGCLGRVLLLSGRSGAVIRVFEPEVRERFLGSPPDTLESTEFGVALTTLRRKGGGRTLAVGADESEAAVGAVYCLDLSNGARARVLPPGEDVSTYQLGWRLDCAGDLDKDGWDDVLCGTFSFFGKDDGTALLYSGKDGHELRRYRRRGNDVILSSE